jgi:hypothetical protein
MYQPLLNSCFICLLSMYAIAFYLRVCLLETKPIPSLCKNSIHHTRHSSESHSLPFRWSIWNLKLFLCYLTLSIICYRCLQVYFVLLAYRLIESRNVLWWFFSQFEKDWCLVMTCTAYLTRQGSTILYIYR